MGCFQSKQTGLRCRQCNGRNVSNIFERLCYGCSLAARRPAAPKDDEKPCFGEYRCGACSRTWTSRMCWPRNYQACMRCRQPVYPFNWRELTAADRMNSTAQEHQREYCQKCQEVGYYCGNYARLYARLHKDCSCDDKNDDTDIDYFPNTAQIWGMLGTLLVVGVGWILFTRMKLKLGLKQSPPPPLMQGRRPRTATSCRKEC